jgi:hypothetical protein
MILLMNAREDVSAIHQGWWPISGQVTDSFCIKFIYLLSHSVFIASIGRA